MLLENYKIHKTSILPKNFDAKPKHQKTLPKTFFGGAKREISEYEFALNDKWIWAVEKNSDLLFTIYVVDFEGNILASFELEDELYDSDVMLSLLPEPHKIVVSLAAGQDGSQDYIFSFENDKLQIINKLESCVNFYSMVNHEKNALLWDFYSSSLYLASYPDFQVVKEYFSEEDEAVSEEFTIGNIIKLSENQLLLCDESFGRYFLFSTEAMKITEEIIVKGYEPALNEDGEMESNFMSIAYHQGRLIFEHHDFKNKKEKFWVEAEAVSHFF